MSVTPATGPPSASDPSLLARMSVNPWFAALLPTDQQALLRHAERKQLRPGEMLFRQGDALSGFYGLVSGGLKISSLREDGREAIFVLLEVGNWFGEISLLDRQPRTHDATALVNSEVLVVPQAAFAARMEGAAFARAIAGMPAGRVRSLYGVVEDAALRSTRARIARRRLLLSRGDVTMAEDARPAVLVSQEALAMMLGMTRQTLSKELKVLAAEGAVALGYRRIEITCAVRLKTLSDPSR